MNQQASGLEYLWNEAKKGFLPDYCDPNNYETGGYSDLSNVLHYAKFKWEQVRYVLGYYKGFNDEDNWVMMVELMDGQYGVVSAGCDYTGWG